jgi:protein TonB
VDRRQPEKAWQARGPWCRWMVASGVFHALLLGGLIIVVGTATRPTATLRARLVTALQTVSKTLPERRPPGTVPFPVTRGVRARARKIPRTSPSSRDITAVESVPVQEASPPEGIPENAAPPLASALPSGPPQGDGEASAPAGPSGEGISRSPQPRSGPNEAQAGPSTAAESEPPPPPPQFEATARGVFLLPGGNGSGTGRAGIGRADQGIGAGGGGTGSGGNGTGAAGLGEFGRGAGAGAGLASRGGGGGVGDLLRNIRRQIEQNKIYPDAARRQGIQGTVELRFRIAADGSVEDVEILRSSGYDILDEASRQTLRRAAPYPAVRGWIRLPLSYRLDQ